MIQLDEFEQQLFDTAYEGKRWMYLPRVEGNRFGLAIAVVGREGKIEVPFDLCLAHTYEAITAHAQDLNANRTRRAA